MVFLEGGNDGELQGKRAGGLSDWGGSIDTIVMDEMEAGSGAWLGEGLNVSPP
jgi:hypothetical protein